MKNINCYDCNVCVECVDFNCYYCNACVECVNCNYVLNRTDGTACNVLGEADDLLKKGNIMDNKAKESECKVESEAYKKAYEASCKAVDEADAKARESREAYKAYEMACNVLDEADELLKRAIVCKIE